MRISDFIEKSNAANSPEQVFDLFRQALDQFGYQRIAFAATTMAAQEALARNDLKPVIALNYPAEWTQHYFDQRYHEVDPVIVQLPTRSAPMIWSEAAEWEAIPAKAKRMFQECREAGLHGGISIPVHGARGESYAVSLASDTPHPDVLVHAPKMQVIAAQFHLAYTQVARDQNHPNSLVRLTERERECLTWTARGKSAWAISMILGVSEHTVNFHIKGVMKKLQTANRIQAVVLAVRLGLIAP